ncbi:MAG TPA: response regulator transcription factor [Kofleriaceae bacterium]|nr:response regulator transcription factor [Kofleriaceae bacterium]
MTRPPIRVFLADDHALVRLGLRQLLDREPDVSVVGEADDGRRVLLAEGKDDWDVLVLDVSLPKVGGIEVLRRLRAEHPRLKVVMLSMYPEDQYAERMVAQGAAAYLSKDRAPEEVLSAIRAVHAGRAWSGAAIPLYLDDEAADGRPAHTRLTAREYQVFTLLFQGSTVTEIAAELDLRASTVSNHVARIKEKLNAHSIAEIVGYAHRAGLVGTRVEE